MTTRDGVLWVKGILPGCCILLLLLLVECEEELVIFFLGLVELLRLEDVLVGIVADVNHCSTECASADDCGIPELRLLTVVFSAVDDFGAEEGWPMRR